MHDERVFASHPGCCILPAVCDCFFLPNDIMCLSLWHYICVTGFTSFCEPTQVDCVFSILKVMPTLTKTTVRTMVKYSTMKSCTMEVAADKMLNIFLNTLLYCFMLFCSYQGTVTSKSNLMVPAEEGFNVILHDLCPVLSCLGHVWSSLLYLKWFYYNCTWFISIQHFPVKTLTLTTLSAVVLPYVVIQGSAVCSYTRFCCM